MFLDFFQGFSLRLRQEERGGDEKNHGESGKHEKHGRVTVFADGRQENSGDGGRNGLVDEQRDAHAVGADARRHQFRQRQPDTYAGRLPKNAMKMKR